VQLAVIRHEIARRKAQGLPPRTEADEGWQIILRGLARFQDACRKALHPSHYDPAQPRVPAGNPDGGRWTRLAASDKPRLGPAAIAAIVAETAKRAIQAYRNSNNLWDLFGSKIGTVAVTTIDGEQIFGSNSTSPTYDGADRAAAVELRDRLIEKYPDVMNTKDVGRRPNDALFHAETTILTRAARANGGTLAGRTIEVHVDREICPSCDAALPYVGLELGNPTVTFVEPTGRRQTIYNGSWIGKYSK
jgi:hypothetical protein